VLYKLADIYKISLDVLLVAAGIITKSDSEKTHNDVSEFEREIAFYKDKFSPEEEQQIISFIKFLRSQNKNGSAAAI
jgi:hypothetical protein